MEDDLLVRGAGSPEHWVVVSVVKVAPEAGVGGWDLVTSEDGGRHPEVVQLGQDLAVQVGEVTAREEGGAEGREELVEEGEGDLQGLTVASHRLKRRLHGAEIINDRRIITLIKKQNLEKKSLVTLSALLLSEAMLG